MSSTKVCQYLRPAMSSSSPIGRPLVSVLTEEIDQFFVFIALYDKFLATATIRGSDQGYFLHSADR